jgi:hypothetical protein
MRPIVVVVDAMRCGAVRVIGDTVAHLHPPAGR